MPVRPYLGVSQSQLIASSTGSLAVSGRAVGDFADPFEYAIAMLAEHAIGPTTLVGVLDGAVNISEGTRFVDEYFQPESEAIIRRLKQNIEGRVRYCRRVIGDDNHACSGLRYSCDYGKWGNPPQRPVRTTEDHL